MQVYTIKRLELEALVKLVTHVVSLIGKELAEDRRSCQQVPVASVAVINLLILRNMYVHFQTPVIYFSLWF